MHGNDQNYTTMRRLIFMLCMAITLQTNAQSICTDSVISKKLIRAEKLLKGLGVTKDYKMAYTIFEECAMQGCAKAMNMLGILCKEGLGVEKNEKKAKEWFEKAGSVGYAQGFYNLGVLYKDKQTPAQDFKKAYAYFEKAANLDDPQSIYAIGYMQYKGLGCQQDYSKAVVCFKKGAAKTMPNSMYFLGLCFRNGYGIASNSDSAKFWLIKAAARNYKMAISELKAPNAENSFTRKDNVEKMIDTYAIDERKNLNQYEKVNTKVALSKIKGNYTGIVVRYDWSGQTPISSSKLAFNLQFQNGQIEGQWIENDTVLVPFKALINSKSLVFKNTSYSRSDHYSPENPILYDFKNAQLNWLERNDSTIINGSIEMFSPDRNEPEKPLRLVLVKNNSQQADVDSLYLLNDNEAKIDLANGISVYPSPFDEVLNVSFKINKAYAVNTQLISQEGVIVYSKPSESLAPGFYNFKLSVPSVMAGTYYLRMTFGKEVKSIKVIKLSK